jgi:hypothetical protein
MNTLTTGINAVDLKPYLTGEGAYVISIDHLKQGKT